MSEKPTRYNEALTSKDNSILRSSGVNDETIAAGTLGVLNVAATEFTRLEEKQRGFISRFFTDRKITGVLEDHQMRVVADFSEYQRKAFQLATDTRLNLAEVMCDTMNKETRVGYQARLTTLVLDKHEELRRFVQVRREAFLADLDGAFQLVEKFSHNPKLAEPYLASLQNEITRYFDWLDKMVGDFMAISEKRLDQVRKD